MTFTFTYLIYASQSMQFHESRDCCLSYLLLLLTMWQRARLEEALMIIHRMSKYFLLGDPAAGPSQLMQGKSGLFFLFSLPHSYFLSLGGFLKKNFFLISLLFLAALGLHCCTWAFSSCSKQGLLCSCAGFSLQWLLLLWSMGFRARKLSGCGAWA